MPPKPKCTREEVAAAAFRLIKEEGLSALTARELGKRLGTSSSPVFTIFQNMDEVKSAARELALAEFLEYIGDYQAYTPAFKRIGMMLVSYGIHEPELFKLLFMQEHKDAQGFESTIRDLGGIADTCRELICRDYGMTREQAVLMLEQMWTQAFGLGAMCAMGVSRLSEEEIGRQLGIMFAGMVMFIKSGRMDAVYADVEHSDSGLYHGMPLNEMPF